MKIKKLRELNAMHFTLNDGKQDDDDKEEEGDVEDHTIEFILITCWILNLISYTSSSSHTHIHVEQITLQSEKERQGLSWQVFHKRSDMT